MKLCSYRVPMIIISSYNPSNSPNAKASSISTETPHTAPYQTLPPDQPLSSSSLSPITSSLSISSDSVIPKSKNVSQILFIRNDGMEDRYSVLITLLDQDAADGFHKSLNGRKYAPSEAEVCDILYVLAVEHTEFEELAASSPVGFTELPTCPICLGLRTLGHEASENILQAGKLS